MRQLTLGTAGHIDHGKTTLVRALTGVDTDRLPEEKRRGITIDLGFASLELPGGVRLGIVDVPGHEAFIRNMLAGATGIDLMLLVVAADEGVMPQTREHLAIIELLGIRRGVVAITKVDAADTDWLELVREDVQGLIDASALAGVPVVDVSARSGAGLEELVRALDAAAAGVRDRRADDIFRMPVDRVFTVRGTGTVVTGTVWSGTLRRDAQVRIEPAGFSARVRTLQEHGVECDEVHAGERAAVALAGIDRQRIGRGDSLLVGEAWQPSPMLTVALSVLADAGAPLRPRQRVRVHLGTAEVLARVALPDGELAPGGAGLAQLRLEAPVVARTGDRLVIRSYSPVHTIGGGVVLEPLPPKRKRFSPTTRHALTELADADRALPALLTLAGAHGVRTTDLPIVTGLTPAAATAAAAGLAGVAAVGDRLIDAAHLDACTGSILRRLERFHREAPLRDGMEREALRRDAAADVPPALFDAALHRLAADGRIAGREGLVAAAGFQPVPDAAARDHMDRLAALYAAAGLQAPDLADTPPDLAGVPELPLLLRHLERQGRLVRLTPDRWTDASAVAGAVAEIRSRFVAGQELGVSDFKEILGLTRKHLIPLLEYFDRVGVTSRAGEARRLEPAAGAAPGAPEAAPPRP